MRGLDAFPGKDWPENIPLLDPSYHIMVGLGTLFVVILLAAAFLLWSKALRRAMDAVDITDEFPVPVYREYGGVYDGGVGGPALVALMD